MSISKPERPVLPTFDELVAHMQTEQHLRAGEIMRRATGQDLRDSFKPDEVTTASAANKRND